MTQQFNCSQQKTVYVSFHSPPAIAICRSHRKNMIGISKTIASTCSTGGVLNCFFFQFFFNCSVVFLFYVFVVFVFLLFYIYFLNVLFLCIFCFFLVLCFFPFFEANRTLCAKVTYPGSGTQTVAFVWGPRDASGEMAMVQDDRY